MDSLSLSSTLLHLKIKASKLRLHGFRIFQRLGGNTKGRNHIVESKGTLRRVSLDTDVSQTHLLSVMSRLEPHAHLHAPKILLKALSSSFFFFQRFQTLSKFSTSSQVFWRVPQLSTIFFPLPKLTLSTKWLPNTLLLPKKSSQRPLKRLALPLHLLLLNCVIPSF